MENYKRELLSNVEELKNKLRDIMNKESFFDEEIIKKSKELDELLNEYYRLVKDEK